MGKDTEAIQELIRKLEDRYDAEDLVDLLGISVEELCEAFEEKLLDNLKRLDTTIGEDLWR